MPISLTLPTLLIFGCLTWFLSTIVAGGGASLLLPLVIILVGSEFAAPSLAIGALIANPTRAFVFFRHIEWKVIRYLLPGTCIGAFVGAYGFSQLDSHHIQLLVGLFLISTLFQERLETSAFNFMPHAVWFLPLGLTVSLISGIVGAIGPVYNPFLISYGISKERLVATKAFNSFVMQAVKVFGYAGFGVVSSETLSYGIAIGLGAAVGVILAKKHLLALDTAQFKRYVYWFMPLLGALFVYQGMKGLL